MQVLTNAASQMAAFGSGPGTPSSAQGQPETEIERELADLSAEAAKLQQRLQAIEQRCIITIGACYKGE